MPELTSEQQMLRRYHNVFGSDEGRIVLGDIATIAHVFDAVDPHDIVLVAQRDLALIIMQMAGALDSLYLQLGIATPNTKKEG
jgi:hypothetical protein